jgi:hypothetical protein
VVREAYGRGPRASEHSGAPHKVGARGAAVQAANGRASSQHIAANTWRLLKPVLTIAGPLGVALRERNTLMLAAGSARSDMRPSARRCSRAARGSSADRRCFQQPTHRIPLWPLERLVLPGRDLVGTPQRAQACSPGFGVRAGGTCKKEAGSGRPSAACSASPCRGAWLLACISVRPSQNWSGRAAFLVSRECCSASERQCERPHPVHRG